MIKNMFTYTHVHLVSLSEQALGESIALVEKVEDVVEHPGRDIPGIPRLSLVEDRLPDRLQS